MSKAYNTSIPALEQAFVAVDTFESEADEEIQSCIDMLVFDNSFASVVEGIKISRTYVRTLQRIFQFSLAAPLPVLAAIAAGIFKLS